MASRSKTAADLLRGAIDMHVHGYPDTGLGWPMSMEDVDLVHMAREKGMRGIVLKSHFWPTVDRAFHLNRSLPDDAFTVFGSITLNPLVGGLLPLSVSAAAAHGAKVVFLPTWGSRNDHTKRGVVRTAVVDSVLPDVGDYLDANAISLTDDAGNLTSAARSVLLRVHELGLVLFTGHVSTAESLALAEEAHRLGYEKLVFSHPLSGSIRASADAMERMADLGATIEFVQVGSVRKSVNVQTSTLAAHIERLGAQRTIITTDLFFDWQPPEPVSFGTYIEELIDCGVASEAIEAMVSRNPRRLLGLEE